jgi:hypothetical protein
MEARAGLREQVREADQNDATVVVSQVMAMASLAEEPQEVEQLGPLVEAEKEPQPGE